MRVSESRQKRRCGPQDAAELSVGSRGGVVMKRTAACPAGQ